MGIPAGYRLDEVYATVGEQLTEELVAFWTEEGVLDQASARERARDVVLVLRDDRGRISGVSSAFIKVFPFLGNRSVWVFRSYVSEPTRSFETFSAMFCRTRDLLESLMHEGTGNMPEGILVMVPDPAVERAQPEAVWPETGLIYMGRTSEGQQLRVVWMKQWRQGGEDPIADVDIPLEWVHERLDDATREEIMAFWRDEDAVAEGVARERVDEVAQIARGEDGRILGVCTLKLKKHADLGVSLWDVRAFVSSEQRRSMLGFALLHRSYERMEEAFVKGEDRRAGGFFVEVQNEGLKRYAPEPLWAYGRFAYIGESPRGDHRRVQYFPGAIIEPPGVPV